MPFPLAEITKKAIQRHFRRKNLVWDEAYFVKMLQTSQNRYDIYWAVLALRDCGTVNCLPHLKEKLHYPMQDVKCTTILTIAHIAGAAETPFYAEALLSPGYREKGYAMWAVKDAADDRAVAAVLAYFKKNRAKLRNGKLTNATLADGLEYLERYLEENEAIANFFAEVESFWPKLPQGERTEIARRVKFFAKQAGQAP